MTNRASTPAYRLLTRHPSPPPLTRSVWDVAEDLVFRKVEESDASAFSRLVGGPPQAWGVLWLFVSVIFFAAGLIIGIVAFKEPLKQQQSEDFLNTRRGLRDDFVVLRPR